MRTTISFSVTPTEAKKTQRIVRKRGFPTTSAYIRFLLDQDDVELISEAELARRAREVDELYTKGELIEAPSLAALIKSSKRV